MPSPRIVTRRVMWRAPPSTAYVNHAGGNCGRVDAPWANGALRVHLYTRAHLTIRPIRGGARVRSDNDIRRARLATTAARRARPGTGRSRPGRGPDRRRLWGRHIPG